VKEDVLNVVTSGERHQTLRTHVGKQQHVLGEGRREAVVTGFKPDSLTIRISRGGGGQK